MSRPAMYELDDEEDVGGRRFPAEKGELLRLDEDDDDGRDDISRGSLLFPPQGGSRARAAAGRGAGEQRRRGRER